MTSRNTVERIENIDLFIHKQISIAMSLSTTTPSGSFVDRQQPTAASVAASMQRKRRASSEVIEQCAYKDCKCASRLSGLSKQGVTYAFKCATCHVSFCTSHLNELRSACAKVTCKEHGTFICRTCFGEDSEEENAEGDYCTECDAIFCTSHANELQPKCANKTCGEDGNDELLVCQECIDKCADCANALCGDCTRACGRCEDTMCGACYSFDSRGWCVECNRKERRIRAQFPEHEFCDDPY